MDEEIQNKLREFREYQKKAQEYPIVHKREAGHPVKINTEADILNYSKWHTKADIALNEFHTLLVRQNPKSTSYSLDQLQKEKDELIHKLKQTEGWLGEKAAV